jgi:hypothetical protein
MVFFPQDPQAGGTWIATSENNFTLCLLNGAFEKHERKMNYRHSRGKVLLDFFEYNDVAAFANNYNLQDIEPFTLIIVNSNSGLWLDELRWDATTLHHTVIDITAPHIWSSATLYTPAVIAQRKEWFSKWIIQHKDYQQEEILKFHEFGGDGDTQNNLVMNRADKVRTLSITGIKKDSWNYTMNYRDLLKPQNYTYRILQSLQSC